MQNGFVEPGATGRVPYGARYRAEPQPDQPHAAASGRDQRLPVQFTTPRDGLESWSVFYERFPPKVAASHQAAFERDAHGWKLWPALDIDREADAFIEKQRLGASIPGTCDLDDFLRARGIDTLIITGTLTSICCRSTARDAMQLNYRVIFPADANARPDRRDAQRHAQQHGAGLRGHR